MERLLAEHAHEVAAVIVEPLVQCAGGMRMYHPVYLRLLRDACDRYGVHLIADEIAVGFGRTGTMFACEQAGITPDFLCVSKGLTGGYLPLSAVLTSEHVYAAFYDDYTKLTAFLHSHSYTGNPLACRAALATLDIFASDDPIASNRLKAERDKRTREPYAWQERRGLRVYRHALAKGLLLRPVGNVIYFMPPYIVNDAEIDFMVATAAEGLELATCD
jgi:adenosylmethionine-8-amino-7-oxononanoate aminotransferase